MEPQSQPSFTGGIPPIIPPPLTPPPTVPPPLTTPPPQQTPPSSSSKLLVLLVLLLVIIAAGSVWYAFTMQKSAPTQQTQQEQSEAPASKITWYENQTFLSDLKLIGSRYPSLEEDGTTQMHVMAPENFVMQYKEVGERDGKKIIMGQEGMQEWVRTVFFEKNSDGTYTFMKNVSDEVATDTTTEGMFFTAPNITIDATTRYADIQPTEFSYDGITFVPTESIQMSRAFFGTESEYTREKIATIPERGDLFIQKPLAHQTSALMSARYSLKSPTGFVYTYTPQLPFMTDNSVPQITWSNGTQNTTAYTKGIVTSCGSPGWTQIAHDTVSATLKPVGTTNTSETIYGFKDLSNPDVKDLYTMFGKRYIQNQGTFPVPESEWLQSNGIVFYKTSHGEYIPLVSTEFTSGAECGKPVIYLYPTKDTLVSVKVGADITVSEPAYSTGWSVKARPNGTLTLANGAMFDSLFWEGTGHGPYPEIRSGTVVARADIERTLRTQLAQLGLNAKESSDFMEFWLPRMPQTPYVRLSWFTTDEMNALAPLRVVPRPDTMIRVFLDFQGLTAPIQIPAQTLSSVERKGFTLVEWGGLLVK